MPFFKWLLGGFAGGAIGSVIWILVSHYLNAEVGYVAWGIGILTGLGVRMASRYDGTPPTKAQSIVAAVIAGTMVLGAKYMVVSLAVDQMVAEQKILLEEDQGSSDANMADAAERNKQFLDSLPKVEFEKSEMPLRLARNEAERRQEAGEELAWPEGKNLQNAETEQDMPPEVMQWANEKVEGMSEEELQAAIEREEQMLNSLIQAMRDAAADQQTDGDQRLDGDQQLDAGQAIELEMPSKFEVFKNTLGFFDLLWIALAVASAYQISADDESNVPPEEV